MECHPRGRSGDHGWRGARLLPCGPAASIAEPDRPTNGPKRGRMILGKFCAGCLEKYVLQAFLPRSSDSEGRSINTLYFPVIDTQKCYFSVALSGTWTHNYKYIYGKGFTPARTPSASPERTGRRSE